MAACFLEGRRHIINFILKLIFMKTLTFKTNIKCGGCIATVSPVLNGMADIKHWEVDTDNADKILTVEGSDQVDAEQIRQGLQEVGYSAEKL